METLLVELIELITTSLSVPNIGGLGISARQAHCGLGLDQMFNRLGAGLDDVWPRSFPLTTYLSLGISQSFIRAHAGLVSYHSGDTAVTREAASMRTQSYNPNLQIEGKQHVSQLKTPSPTWTPSS